MRKSAGRFLTTLFVACAVPFTAAAETTVVEDLIDLLKEKGQIDSQTERALREKAAAERDRSFRLFWKDGLRIHTAGDAFKLRIGGRLNSDWAVFSADNDVESAFPNLAGTPNGTEFRRSRIYLAGTVFERIDFKTQYDFAGGEAAFKDIWLAANAVPTLGSVKLGHFKEAFSLEQMTSGKYITFMERSLADALVPGRNTGIAVGDLLPSPALRWMVGLFRETDNFGDGFSSDTVYNATTRLAATLLAEADGKQVVHLGLNYSRKFMNADTYSVSARPEAHLSPVRLAGASVEANGVDTFGGEAAAVLNSLSLQAEYIHSFVDAVAGSPDPEFQGYYIYGSWFVTGESRAYKQSKSAFDRVRPNANFLDGAGGTGAIEVGVRYSSLDLDSGAIEGGELNDVTVGLNWYLNPHVRLMFNYVRADLDGVGDTDIFQSRLHLDI